MTCLTSFAQSEKLQDLQVNINNAVKRVFNSSVQIMAYDSTKQTPPRGMFSGVVVSPDGFIITVAHASKPGQLYQVTYPDGKQFLAKGLGRMSIKNDTLSLDLAVIKISNASSLPFAEMGNSANLKQGQSCIGISYPGSFFKKVPNVRYGKLTDVHYAAGYFVSTCKMEPGDSGGPLFDLNGMVIGIHSWVEVGEDRNFEVPVDLYKKYWTALCKPEDYKSLPPASSLASLDPPRHSLLPAGAEAISLPRSCQDASVKVISYRNGMSNSIGGSLLTMKIQGRKRHFVVSKSSMVFNNPYLEYGGRKVDLHIVKRDRKADLALLELPAALKNEIDLDNASRLASLSDVPVGTFLISCVQNEPMQLAVLSSTALDMPLRYSGGNFGANATFINQKVTLTDIRPGTPAARYLKLKDHIQSINGVPILKPIDYGRELRNYYAGDSLTITLVRDSLERTEKMLLPPYPPANHVASRFEGGRSMRSDGFEGVYVQDATIAASNCGGPVFSTSGLFYGLNIARHSRTATVITPVETIKEFIARAIEAH